MNRKIILNLAISLDGCIADENGGYDWIGGHNDSQQNTEKQFNFSAFTKSCDTIVMGRKSYEDCGIKDIEDYTEKRFLVVTSELKEKDNNIEFISDDIVKMITELKNETGENIWLYGGAKLTDKFIKADIIDEYIIGIIPVILGKGRKLFFDEYPFLELHLKQSTVTDGIVVLHYTRRKAD